MHCAHEAKLQNWCSSFACAADSFNPALAAAEDDNMDATVTYKPGQLSQILANPELLNQLKGHRGTKAPEAGHIHLTPDTDPENTFRTRQANKRPRVRFEELFAPEDPSNHGDQAPSGAIVEDEQQSQEQV